MSYDAQPKEEAPYILIVEVVTSLLRPLDSANDVDDRNVKAGIERQIISAKNILTTND